MSEISCASIETADERSAEEVAEAKEALLASDRGEFVDAVRSGKLISSKCAIGLGDVSEDIRDAALSVGRAALSEVSDKEGVGRGVRGGVVDVFNGTRSV